METCLTIYVTFEGLGFCCFNPDRQGVDAVLAALQVDGEEVFRFDKGVDPRSVTRFFVTITNTCELLTPQPQSDFQKYYEVLDFQSDVKFDFDLAEKPLAAPRPAMCEFTWLSKTKTLAGFF